MKVCRGDFLYNTKADSGLVTSVDETTYSVYWYYGDNTVEQICNAQRDFVWPKAGPTELKGGK